MSNEEIIAVEATMRSYNSLVHIIEDSMGKLNNSYSAIYNPEVEKARGKVDGCKEVLRDLMNAKIS
jgi:hypothetical protein